MKKGRINLIIIIVVIIIIIAIGVVLFIKFSNNNGNLTSSNKIDNITEEGVSNYGLEIDTVWINKPLGIIYNIPKQISGSMLNGTSSFTYMHGSSFSYYNGYKIYVDKSLEGHTNLKTLASDIIEEKQSDKYKAVYGFGSNYLRGFNNNLTKNVKINGIDAVYFESEELNASSVVGNELKVKIIGYSFEYNGQYISVYGELLVEEKNKAEELKQIQQYIIKSIKKHEGESLQELGGNAKNYYDDGYTNYFNDEIIKKITINYLSSHTNNGGLRTSGNSSDVTCTALTTSNVSTATAYSSWDKTLDGIFEATKNTKYDTFGWRNDDGTVEVLEKEKVKINNIDMNRYIIKYRTGLKGGYFAVIYTFIIDNVPYVFSYNLSKTIYNGYSLNGSSPKGTYITDLTEEQANVYIAQTKAVAESFIYTIQIFDKEDALTYQKYINTFN